MKKTILAGGCFWGLEAYFQRVKGVLNTKVGYIDGFTNHPTYDDVCDGSGHAEACYIEYNEKLLDLKQILKHLFRIIDPTQINRQGNDLGVQYRTAIYYVDEEDQVIANEFIDSIRNNYKSAIQTKVLKATEFFDAESYHQKYLDKNPLGYCHINLNILKEEIK